MKIGACTVQNFGSYSSFEFDFNSTGLSLVYGPTGSGKSTLQDMACWILFGITAKDGAVDEVRSWQSPGDPTRGTLDVELPDGKITVTRVRGKPSENDLYWTEANAPDDFKRGKDLAETQKHLERRLGVSAELYIACAYFHEFSPSGQFFVSKSKDRRALLERIAPLELPKKIAEACTVHRKRCKEDLAAKQTALAKLKGKEEQLEASFHRNVKSATDWNAQQKAAIEELEARSKGFETEKETKAAALLTRMDRWNEENHKKIDELIGKLEDLYSKIRASEEFDAKISKIQSQSRCITCGALPDKATTEIAKVTEARLKNAQYLDKIEDLKELLRDTSDAINPYLSQFEQAKSLENHYTAQIEIERGKANPFNTHVEKIHKELMETTVTVVELFHECKSLERRVNFLSRLYDLSSDLRGELLRKAVKEIEASTNGYLEKYFDAELRVSFELEGDSLEVSIQKSGYDCVYRQLSKGQRGLLKLAFSASIMDAAANNAGVHFDCLMFDEALDGLDSDLKVKAFSLFEELESEHSSILLIDHSDALQNMFARRYRVQLNGDTSEMTLESEN